MARNQDLRRSRRAQGRRRRAAAPRPVYTQKLDAQGRAYATGKRKNAVARVWIKPGAGKITVNDKDFDAVLRPSRAADAAASSRCRPPTALSQFDVMATVAGGGLSGQAGAVRHGISKALTYFEPELRARAQEGRLPHPRQPRRRAQEVRQA